MNAYKISAVILLLAMCILAIALGYAGSKSIPEKNTAVVNMDANSTGIVIPEYLITNEVRNILSEISSKYPDGVLFGDEQVTLIGSKTVDAFKNSINENDIGFDWAAVHPFYELETLVVTAGPYIVYSPISSNSITVSYDELEKILNGNNETVSYYRELLNNSKHESNIEGRFCVEGGNVSVVSVAVIKDNSPLQHSGAVMSISSSGNYSE